jgi:hypothetical protein
VRPERPQVKTSTELQAVQAGKIRELQEVLVSAGYWSLDQQSKVLGLPRSTSWTILRGTHKKSGLSVGIIKRILSAPELPSVVKEHLIEYVREKSAGLYGHNPRQVRRFTAALISAGALSGEAVGQRNAALDSRRDQLGKGSG